MTFERESWAGWRVTGNGEACMFWVGHEQRRTTSRHPSEDNIPTGHCLRGRYLVLDRCHDGENVEARRTRVIVVHTDEQPAADIRATPCILVNIYCQCSAPHHHYRVPLLRHITLSTYSLFTLFICSSSISLLWRGPSNTSPPPSSPPKTCLS